MGNDEDKKARPPTGTQPRVSGPSGAQRVVSETFIKGQTAIGTASSAPTPPLGSNSQQQATAPAQPPPNDGDPYMGQNVAGRYKILKKLGEGGMGVVYLAEHVFIEKKVAIKILSEDFARKADLVARFMQEAKAASKIGHENIIDITDFGETPNGSVFFVMEFLDGADLAHHIKSGGAMSLQRAKYIMNQICRALGAAHSKGIIHRDMKPENIYLVEREGKPDFVKILDFGIAKISSLDEGGSRLTRTGMIFGTPEYMSPEQARGDKPDHRVDIYAAGCILYEMLTGDTPFHADTFMGVLTKHMFEAPVPPSQRSPQAGIPADVEAVVLKALTKDRDQRFQTMKELAVALEEATGGDPSDAWGSEGSQVMPVAGRTSSHAPISKPPSRTPAPVAEEPPPKSKAPLFIGLGLVLALGGAGALFALSKKPPPPAPAPIAVKPPEPKIEPPKPVEPAKPAEVKRSKIEIRSTPGDAQVFNGPELLGSTPAALEYTADTAPFEVTLKKKGFKEQKLRIAPDRNREYVIELVKEKGGGSSSSHVSKPAAPEPKVEAKPEPKVEPKPAGKLRDLKDPFAN